MGEQSKQGHESFRTPPSSDHNGPTSSARAPKAPASDRAKGRATSTLAAGSDVSAPRATTIVSAPPPAGTSAPRVDRTLEVHGAAARVIARALDSTRDATPKDGGTPPTSSDRLAQLAAHLPRVPRDAYTVGNQVARGGIGRVMRARDERLDRPVAIKELLVWNEAQEQRFIREALLTARLQHPAIVPIYEAGRWPDGEPYYAMKLVSGRSLAELIAERKTLEERLALLPHVITVAQAVAYAHSQHILHRDLKPANVLVGEFGETVVIDWGLAKGLADEEARQGIEPPVMTAEGLTIEGAVVGTPAYMPPEQAKGAPVDERADIYAIGAMLYHVIAAVPPYHDIPWEKMLSTISTERPKRVEAHAPAISDELCAIVQKAMAREPRDRYQSAKELADDLQRFASGQIVAAHTYSAAQLLRRFWRRNRSMLTMAASALALVTLVVIGAFIKTDQDRRLAIDKKHEADQARQAADSLRTQAEEAGRQATARADEMTLLQAEGALAIDPNEAVAWLKTLSPKFSDAAELRRLASDANARGLSRAFRGHKAHINDVTLFPDAKRFVTASDDKTLRVWDMATGQSKELVGHTDEVWRVDPLADGNRVISLSKDQTVRVWDVTTGAELSKLKLPGVAKHMAVRPDDMVVLAGWDVSGVPYVWHIGDKEGRALTDRTEDIRVSQGSSDGRWVILQRQDGTVEVIEVDTGKVRQVGHGGYKKGVWHLSADGRGAVHRSGIDGKQDVSYELWNLDNMSSRTTVVPGAWHTTFVSATGHFVAAVSEASVEVHDMRGHVPPRKIPGSGSAGYWSTFSPDNRLLATGDWNKTVHVWDLTSGEIRSFAGLRGVVSNIRFLPGNQSILASSSAGEVRLFNLKRSGSILAQLPAQAAGLAVSPDGRSAALDQDGHLRVTDLSGRILAETNLPKTPPKALCTSPDGAQFAGIPAVPMEKKTPPELSDNTVLLGTFDDRAPRLVELQARPTAFVWDPSSTFVVVGLADGIVYKLDAEGKLTELDRLNSAVRAITFSADGKQMAAGGLDGKVRLTDLSTLQHKDLGRHDGPVRALTFSPDGQTLASGSSDHTFRLWRLEDGTFRPVNAGGGGVIQLAFDKAGRSLYVLNDSETIVRRWATGSLEPLPSFTGHSGPVVSFSFSKDRSRILTWSLDRSARLFDVASGKSRALIGHKDHIVQAALTNGDKMVLTLGSDGAVRAWPDDLPETVPELRAWLDAATTDRIDGK